MKYFGVMHVSTLLSWCSDLLLL